MNNAMVYSMRLAGNNVRQQGTVEGHGSSSWQHIKGCPDGGARHSAHGLSS